MGTTEKPVSSEVGRTGDINEVPPELLAEVASLVYPDVKALKALALVSRMWRAPAQLYLFTATALTVRADSERSRPGRRIKDLEAVLAGEQRLATYITQVIFKEDMQDKESRREWDRTLCALLPLFVNLTRLSLVWTSHMRWANAHAGYAPPVSPELVSVLKATFGRPQLVHVELKAAPLSWVRLLSPQVQSVGIWHPFIDMIDNQKVENEGDNENDTPMSMIGTSKPSPFSHVRPTALLVDGTDWAWSREIGETIKQLLNGGIDTSRIRRLAMGLLSSPVDTHSHVAELLNSCAGTLEELSITPSFKSYAPARDNYTDVIQLRALPHLRVLHVSGQAGIVNDEIEVEPVKWVLAQLKRFPANNQLETLILSSQYTVYETTSNYGFFGLNFDAYGKLEKTLLARKFSKFKMCIIYTEDPDTQPTNKLLLWIAIMLARFTRELAHRNAFAFLYGDYFHAFEAIAEFLFADMSNFFMNFFF